MDLLSGGEKFIVVIVIIGLVIFGMLTVYSQINYSSPFAVFTGNAKPRKQPIKVEQPPPVQTKTATIRQDLNFRPAPGTNNKPYYVLKSGTRVNVISVNNGWAKITDSSGKEGYVDNSYLQY